MVNKDKKFIINEGRQITNGNIFYGGFPRVLKEQEEGVVKKFEDNPLDSSEKGTIPVATQPDSIDGGETQRGNASSNVKDLESQLDGLINQFEQNRLDFNDEDNDWGLSSAGRKAAGEIQKLKTQIFELSKKK